MQGKIRAVSVSAALGRKGGIAAIHSAAVKEPKVHILIVQLYSKVILELFTTVHTAAGILLVHGDFCLKQLITKVLSSILIR